MGIKWVGISKNNVTVSCPFKYGFGQVDRCSKSNKQSLPLPVIKLQFFPP
jgi:hypothetical protein